MTFDEFADKLRKIRADYRRSKGRDLITIEELEKYLDRRLAKRPKRTALRSLRGIL
jgi:hypothetical protein